jgi:hypothetical protein
MTTTKIGTNGLLALMLGAIGLTSDAHSDSEIEHCTTGDVSSVAQAYPQGFLQQALGIPTPGIPDAILQCQARLYDDNGPSNPHVWCEQDLFLLGILVFDNWKALGIDREIVANYYEQFVHQVFWTTAAETTELEVTRTTTRDAVVPGAGHLLVFQDYTILGSLQPGYYVWEWIQKHPDGVGPGNPDGIVFTAAGEVEIVSHEEHLLRVTAGTW